METTSGVARKPYHQRRVWRGSLLLHFGEEVGESLEELGQEFDQLMTDLEYQKSRLKSFSPQESAIQEEEGRPASPASSEASNGQSSLSKHTSSSSSVGGIKNSFRSIKRRFSNRSNAQRSSPLMPRKNEDSSSLNSEDVKAHSEDEMPSNQYQKLPSNHQAKLPSNGKSPDYPLPMAYDQVESASCSVALSAPGKVSKPPISPGGKKGAGVHRARSATVSARDAHMIAPPVMVDGEVKHEYQYVSPARHVGKIGAKNDNGMAGIFRSSSFAKILGLSENERSSEGVGAGSGRSKEESPLKALYKATVLNECNNKENQNNNSSSRKDARRSIVIPALKVT